MAAKKNRGRRKKRGVMGHTMASPPLPPPPTDCRQALRRMRLAVRRGEEDHWHQAHRYASSLCMPSDLQKQHVAFRDPDLWAARVRKDEGRCVVCGRPQYKDAEGYVHELACVINEDGEQRCVHADNICDPTGEIREALRADYDDRTSLNTLSVSSAPRVHVTDAVENELSRKTMRQDGPLLDVTIRATCKDGTACSPVKGKALLDTGASKSALDFGAVEGAKPEGFIRARGPTSAEISLPLYQAKLSFPGTDLDEVTFDDAAASPHLRDQGLVALLGRDFLEHAQLNYDGPTGEVTISTPGGTHVTSSTGVGTGTMVAVSGALVVGALLAWWLVPASCPAPTTGSM